MTSGPHHLSDPLDTLFADGGETGQLMRARDWAATTLGPPAAWPKSLKTCVRIILTSRQPMFVWWGPQLINLYNDAYRDIVGGKHPRALGLPASQVWREIWDQVGPRVDSTIKTNRGTYDEALLLIMHRHGYEEETYYTFSYSPVPDDDGAISGIICANTDETRRIVDERRLAVMREVAARSSQARDWRQACQEGALAMRSEPKDIPFAFIYMSDDEHRHAMLAGSAGTPVDAAVAPATIDLGQDDRWLVAKALATREIQLIEPPPDLVLPLGSWPRPPRQVATVPILPSGDTGRAGVLIVGLNPYRPLDAKYRDYLGLLSGQLAAAVANAQAYEAERQRAEALAQLDSAKTVFFSNVSHEFRTPLTLMLSPVEDSLNDQDQPLTPRQRERQELIYRNAQRLLKLVNSLLDFSRIEAGRIQASFAPVDLCRLTADLASIFRSAVERVGLSFTVDCQTLPQPTYVDHDMWEKIVLNLVSNAFKHTFSGGISVTLRDAGDGARLRVTDTGIGIASEQIPRLFERFHRVQGARSRTHEGTGIGLALVLELTKLHGGTIAVESVVDRGTSFTVSIPYGREHLAADRVRQAEPSVGGRSSLVSAFADEATRWLPDQESSSASDQAADVVGEDLAVGEADALPARILVADDNADMRSYVVGLLGRRWVVQGVADGEAALAAARANPPDLVLSDIMMPRLDGYGLLKELRLDQRTSLIPVILLSARAGEESRVEGMESGADDYLVKPFSARELVAKVTARIDLGRLRRAWLERERSLIAQSSAADRRAGMVLEAMDEAYCAYDAQWRLTYANAVARRLDPALGDAAGRPLAELLSPAIREEVLSQFQRCVRDQAPVHFDLQVPATERWYRNRCYPLQGGGMADFWNDITDARRAEEALRRSNAELEQFAYVAAHDLQEPLRTITLYTEILLKRLAPTDPTSLGQSERIRAASSRMRTLLTDLLDYSRVIHSDPLDEAPIADLNQVVQDARQLLTDAIERAQAELIIEPLPAVRADPGHATLVMQNLIGNAVKYRRDGSTTVVHLRARRDGRDWIISVSDNGIGFDPAQAERIFGLFKRLHGTDYPGTGLGLAICRRIVQRYGGSIWAESKGEGQGSSFQVRLPAV